MLISVKQLAGGDVGDAESYIEAGDV